AHLDIDFAELEEQSRSVEEQLGELLSRVEQQYGQVPSPSSDDEEEFSPESAEQEELSDADRKKIEKLFGQARENRSKAFELKQLLDRLGVFKEYEDRFLDLFKKAG